MSATYSWIVYAAGVAMLVFAIVFALEFTARRRAMRRLGGLPLLARMTASVSQRRRAAQAVMWTLAIGLCVLALAQPSVEGESTWKQRGIDIAVVMDYSKSMMAQDVYPSRYERMTYEVDELLDALEADRVSTVVFAGAAVHFPLTHDYEAARLLYRGLSPLDVAPGSDIGEALMVARCTLRPDVIDGAGCERIGGRGTGGDPLPGQQSSTEGDSIAPPGTVPQIADRARAIVVFTDGEDTVGNARTEVEAAVALGIQIYFVGVGTTAGELIPEFDRRGNRDGWKKDDSGSFVTTRLDQAALRQLAVIAGGDERYFAVGKAEFDREELVAHLSRLKKGDLQERVVRRKKPIFQLLLLPAFLLLLLEVSMGDRRGVRYSEDKQ